jgi:outer membrane protein OmpA-like peptidoglycan-associated protein
MPRRGVTLVVAVLAVAAVVVAGGLSWKSLRSTPPSPVPLPGSSAAVIRDPASTVYIAPSGILFDVDSAALSAEAVPTLRAIVADIEKSRLVGTIRVEGYTDDVGPSGYNLTLSRDRAQTVATWLVREAGLDGARIRVIAFGERSPAQPNDSDAHRQANRRVVIAVER